MTEMKPQMGERKEWIDISRGLAIILVVIGHSLQTFNLVLGYHPNPSLDLIIYSFHMPFFFFLSGYLFQHRKRIETKFPRIFLTNFQRLVLPCFGTILVVLLYLYFISSAVQKSTLSSSFVQQFIIVALYGSGKPIQFFQKIGITSPFWFLLCLCAANLLFWLIMKLTQGRSIVLQAATVIGISYGGVFIGRQGIYLPWSFDIALASQIFLYTGCLISTINFTDKKAGLHLGIILISLSVSVLSIWMGGISMNERDYHNFAISASGGIAGSILLIYLSHMLERLALPFSSAIFSIFTRVIRSITSIISWIGKEALIIYCLHVLDISFFSWFYFQPQFLQLIFTSWVSLTVFRLFYCLIMIDIIRRIPFIRSLFYWKEYPIFTASATSLSKLRTGN